MSHWPDTAPPLQEYCAHELSRMEQLSARGSRQLCLYVFSSHGWVSLPIVYDDAQVGSDGHNVWYEGGAVVTMLAESKPIHPASRNLGISQFFEMCATRAEREGILM